ncbi:MAG TPA: cysteine synthase family protein [archaeon]|nr:cysteine synthase family protein [archaeon]
MDVFAFVKDAAKPISENVLELIGNTPIVRINRLTGKNDATVLAKLEKQNIGGSIKDRIAKYMIEQAEKEGKLIKGKIILEPTSGNTGIGLAIVAAVKGYKTIFVMSKSASEERKKILKAFGASFILTPKEKGTDGAIEVAYKMAKKEPDKYFLPDQFNNPDNYMAHYETTGKEIIEQTGGKIDMVVVAMGTTGTLMGVRKRMKEFDPKIKVVGVEPYIGHKIQGMKSMKEAYRPGIYDRRKVDEKINIKDEDAFETTRDLAKEEGLLVGPSSGAVMHIALKKAKELGKGKVIVAILPDTGERYLSTEVFK